MSRIGTQTITIPEGVLITQLDDRLDIKGPLGKLDVIINNRIGILIDKNILHVTRAKDNKESRSFHGLTRVLIANAIIGVTQGFTKELELHGIGYRATLEGNNLVLILGYSHPIVIPAPEGIRFGVQKNIITVSGIDKQKVGQISAIIREKRKPEPYKGKGIRYAGEHVRRKAGKTAKSAS